MTTIPQVLARAGYWSAFAGQSVSSAWDSVSLSASDGPPLCATKLCDVLLTCACCAD